MKRIKGLAALCLVAAVVVLSGAGCARSEAATPPKRSPGRLTVKGSGSFSAVPDRARLYFGVNAKAKTGPAAMESCSRATARIVDALVKAGLDKREIASRQISLEPYWGTGGKREGYRAVQSIVITTGKIDRLGALVTAATDIGAALEGGPDLFVSSANAARARAVGQAMADARGRAEAIARAAGQRLGSVVSIDEQTETPAQPYYAHGSTGWDLSAARHRSPQVPVFAGEQEQRATVTAVFTLE